MEKPEKLYLIWHESKNYEDTGYFEQFDCIEDALSQGQTEIFIARPKSIGTYKMITKPVRIKKRKKRARGKA